jgi:hypothetical protein
MGGSHAGNVLPALRSLQKALTRVHEDVGGLCEGNIYALDYLCSAAVVQQKQQQQQQIGKA